MNASKPEAQDIKPGQTLTTFDELVAGVYATEQGGYLSGSFGPGWARGTLVREEQKHEPSDTAQS